MAQPHRAALILSVAIGWLGGVVTVVQAWLLARTGLYRQLHDEQRLELASCLDEAACGSR